MFDPVKTKAAAEAFVNGDPAALNAIKATADQVAPFLQAILNAVTLLEQLLAKLNPPVASGV